ncbi:hypothetical protein LTR37_019980 [Vermiconidia calcicola]|uniref:Uncharacterized protein n=1 Tax=Vermiconidia calcicola TaxID=1690605 RepID=A0ACC3MCY2_9PEZI|nr:hypothetical protein LTR37_019980 [Vermiconidia calcicola]
MQPATNVAIRASGTGIDKYPAKAHAQRVADKLKLSNGLILLKAAKQQYYPDSDQPVPFRQERSFYYLTGCNEPDSFVTYETAKDKLTLWLPEPAGKGRRVFYDGRGSTKQEALEKYDVDEVKIIHGPAPKKTNLRKLFWDHYEAGGEFAMFKMPVKLIGKPLRLKMKERRKFGLRAALNQCRIIKDEHEVKLIRKANEVSAEAHKNVMKQLVYLKSEAEVEAVFLGTCLAHRAKDQAYGPICGSGSNAGQLHYTKNDRDFGKSQLLLVDAGAQWQQYASDVTRTMPLNSKFWPSEEAEAVYTWVARIQEECIAQLKPGKKFIEVAFYAVHRAIDALLEMGILKGDKMEIFHAGTVLAFFPHGLGHHLGLDVHDVPPAQLTGSIRQAKKNGPKKSAGKKAAPKKDGEKKNGNESDWEVLEKEQAPSGIQISGPSGNIGIKNVDNKKPGPKMAGPKAAAQQKKEGAAAKKPAGPADPRFKGIQAAYRAFCADNEAIFPQFLSQKPMHYSIAPKRCFGPNTPMAPALKAGMVVTVEPGIYFNKFILNARYLNDESHAKFINKEVLDKFMNVGGVRIEDNILITKDGYENLTTAPKGEEMLKLIKRG